MCIGANVEGVGCHPGIPREQMEVGPTIEREYLAELDALGSPAKPDEPRSLCWDCRRLYAYGQGPQAQRLRAALSARAIVIRAIRIDVPNQLAVLANMLPLGSPEQEQRRQGRLSLASELLGEIGDAELSNWLATIQHQPPQDTHTWEAAMAAHQDARCLELASEPLVVG